MEIKIPTPEQFNFKRTAIIILLVLAITPLNGFAQGAVLERMIETDGQSIVSINFSPDGRFLICGGISSLTRFDLRTEKLLYSSLDYQSGVIHSVVFSPNGRFIASADDAGQIKIRHSQNLKEKRILNPHLHRNSRESHDYRIFSVCFTPDGNLLASGSGGFECRTCPYYGDIKLWDMRRGKLSFTFPKQEDYIVSVSFSPDGNLLASRTDDKTVVLWDVKRKIIIRKLVGHTGGVMSIVFSPNGKYLATSSGDNTVKVWDVRTGKALHTFRNYKVKEPYNYLKDPLSRLAFFDNRRIVAVAGTGIQILHVDTKAVDSMSIDKELYANCVAVSPDGTYFVVGTAEGIVMFWKMK